MAATSAISVRSQAQPGPVASVEVWLDLTEPALASLPRGPDSERAAAAERIRRQQDAVAAQVLELGGRELTRVRLLRNAIAVSLPLRQLEVARKLPGVKAIRPALPMRRD